LVISERKNSVVIRDRIFFRSCGIPQLLGFHSFSSDDLFPPDPALPTDSEALRKLKRLELDGLAWDENDLQTPLMTFSNGEAEKISKWLEMKRRKPNTPLIAIAPGTKKPACAWPLTRFAELGMRLIRETGGELVVVGGRPEKKLGDELISAWGEGINAAGTVSVRDAANLLSKCDLYVGVDTGTTHLAAAAGTPWFAIFHQRDNPGQWYPLGDLGFILTGEPVRCAGCRSIECPVAGHPCMKGISVDTAWESLKTFISKTIETSGRNLLIRNPETQMRERPVI
jgi:ADP-heptose:LPS heptosyltransferase